MARWDISYRADPTTYEPFATVDLHFCREWDEKGNGCYGTNPNHGFSWEEAREEVARFYEQRAAYWRTQPEPTDGR